MSIWSKYECKGQMTIFDFADIPETPSVAESSQSKINEIEEREILKGSGFENGKTRIYNFFKDDHTEKECVDFLKNEYGIGGWSIEEGMCDHSANGIDIKFDKLIGKCSEVHIGWPMVARRIKELIANGKYKPNEEKIIDDNWHDIEKEPQEGAFCLFEYLWTRERKDDSKGCCKGWWKNKKVEWLNMPYDIGKKRVIRWKAEKEPITEIESDDDPEEDSDTEKPLCSKAEECEAYPLGCGGTIEPCRFGGPFNWSNKSEDPKEDVHIDREGREHKPPSWMEYKRCENCIRWQRYDIKEQPPSGWGVMGYCIEHKYRCSTANYCNDFDDKNEVKNG